MTNNKAGKTIVGLQTIVQLYPLCQNYDCNCIVAAKSENASVDPVLQYGRKK